MDPDFIVEAEPPWHFWGQQETVVVRNSSTGSPVAKKSPQLARVGYRRPDTWHWVFGATVDKADPQATTDSLIEVHFDLIVGVGRSVLELKDFEVFTFAWAATDPAPQGASIYSTEALAPPRVWNDPDPTTNRIDQIVAETIQCTARIFFEQVAPIEPFVESTVSVTAMFAPKTHIRPDWFVAPNHTMKSAFRGKEIGGK